MSTNHEARYRDEESAIPEPSIADSENLQVRSRTTSAGQDSERLPVWMREETSWSKWLPLPVRKATRSAARVVAFVDNWTKGPKEAQKQEIVPLLPLIQEAPLWLVERFLLKRLYKVLALVLLYAAWATTFILVIRQSAASGNIEGYGTPNSIWCGASFWNEGNQCGLNGANCRPFEDVTFAFKCPGNCKSVHKLEEYSVGDQIVIYDTLVVGGSNDSSSTPTYRADSFICQAAIHAGVVSNTNGGCGVALLTGTQKHYSASLSNGIQSVGFDADFPKSFSFLSDLSSECGIVDNRWALLGVTATFTAILSLFVSSPAVFFFSEFTIIFIHVGMVSDPPNIMDKTELFSNIIGKFLPAMFHAFVFYRYCVRPTLQGLTAQVEKTILWLGACWIGALDNYTFSHIPIQRLTPRDLKQPGAVLALVIIVILIFLISLGQIYHLRLEHRLRTYICFYAGMAALLLVGVALPMLNLRIHHYILAMLLLPGTALQTRPSLLYQGLLIGLFINGVARWGFGSILETSFALFGGGGGGQESRMPNITAVAGVSSIRFSWSWPPEGYDGVSVLRNDLEVFRWYFGEGNNSYTARAKHLPRDHDDYFRFAYMRGSSTGDFSHAGTWTQNGSWTGIPSKDD